jgi:hypothetical protein
MLRKFIQSLFTLGGEPQLGRWKRLDTLSTIQKIDWANEDHCGTCSNGLRKQFLKTETKNQKSKEK